MFVAEYDPTGAVQYAKCLDNQGSGSYAHGICVGSGGAVYVVGEYTTSAVFGSNVLNSTGFYDLYLSKLASTLGDQEWTEDDLTYMVFPNPITEFVEVEFTLDKHRNLNFELMDVTGKSVTLLLRERVKTGLNKFTFSIANLNPGVYFLKISESGGVVGTKRIVKL